MGGITSSMTPKHHDSVIAALPKQAGRTIVITGTTSGTGFLAAKEIALLGARVVMLNRPSQRSKDALENLKKLVPDAEFEAVDCDLTSFASVRDAAEKTKALCADGIDVLCLNAGIMALKDIATEDGYDIQMQVNHLSHFLLAKELYPLLEKAADAHGEARIVNHSSLMRKKWKPASLDGKYFEKNGGNLGGDKFGMTANGAPWIRYAISKLANAVFTQALHQKLEASNSKVKAVVAHPGFTMSPLHSKTHMPGIATKIYAWMPPEDGCLPLITCCVAADVASGEFYGPQPNEYSGHPGSISIIARESESANTELLWSLSEKAIGESFAI